MHYVKRSYILGILALLLIELSIPQTFCQEINKSLDFARQMSEAYVKVAEDIKPAVVTIECVNIYFNSEEENSTEPGEIINEDMLPDEVHRFINRMQEDIADEVKAGRCTGTGVIISEDGVVVTNNHVVKDAVSIKVRLDNGELLKAEIIGTDPKTDLAVLHLLTDNTLPVATLGDSAACKVGSIVIAIGAPIGFEQSVTFGHISALQRSNEILYYEDELIYLNFIQTDAAVNHGNSGGPLINLNGEVIGINSNGGYGEAENLNFAIPVNTVKNVVKKTLEYGEVPRGYIGVATYDLNNYYNGKVQQGLLVEKVHPNTPAALAGFKMGDILLSFNGTKLISNQQVLRLVSDSEIGSKAVIKYLRNRHTRSKKVTIAAQPERLDMPVLDLITSNNTDCQRPESYESELLGITVVALPLQNGFPDDIEFFKNKSGLLITEIDDSLSTYTSDLIPGMIIKFINFTKVNSLKDIAKLEKKIEPGSEVLIQALLNEDIPITTILDLGLNEDVNKIDSSN